MELPFNNIYHIDCYKGIKLLDNKSINLCVTSVPYNLWNSSKYSKIDYNKYKDDVPFEDYLEWLTDIFTVLKNKMTEDGRVVINIGDKKNGAIPTHIYIANIMYSRGFSHYTTIIWNKSQISRRTAWGSILSPSCPSFPTPFEYILVFHNGNRKLIHKGETDLTKQEFIDWSLALWTFTPETKMKKLGHPAMFPEELPKRCIKMFSYPGDVVLDPFSGLGTTCLVAKNLNRKYIGFEMDEKYYKASLERLEND